MTPIDSIMNIIENRLIYNSTDRVKIMREEIEKVLADLTNEKSNSRYLEDKQVTQMLVDENVVAKNSVIENRRIHSEQTVNKVLFGTSRRAGETESPRVIEYGFKAGVIKTDGVTVDYGFSIEPLLCTYCQTAKSGCECEV